MFRPGTSNSATSRSRSGLCLRNQRANNGQDLNAPINAALCPGDAGQIRAAKTKEHGSVAAGRRVGRVSPLRAGPVGCVGAQRTDAPYLL